MLHGNVTLDELMSRLLAAHEQYTAQVSVEIREEEERAARDAVKREQDLAFEMSLMVNCLGKFKLFFVTNFTSAILQFNLQLAKDK